MRLSLFRECQEMFRVAAAQLIGGARSLKSLGRVFADRVQHREPVISVSQEALLDERLERIEVSIGDLFGRLERAAAVEDSESREEALLVKRQQLAAPFDRCP